MLCVHQMFVPSIRLEYLTIHQMRKCIVGTMCQNNVVIVVAYEQFLLLRTKRDAVPIHLYDRIRHLMRIKKNALTNIKQHLVHSMRIVPFRLERVEVGFLSVSRTRKFPPKIHRSLFTHQKLIIFMKMLKLLRKSSMWLM